ncbi:MAG: S8 family serine peptidase [Archaeoglobaceae archaeon]
MKISNAFKSILVLLLALVLVTGFTVASPADNPTEKVIIGFKDKPDASLVKAHGGNIKYQYTIVDAIAATVPEKAVDALKKNPNVEYVEMDKKVHALEEDTLDWGVDRIDAEIVWGGSDEATDITTDNAGTGVKVAILDTGIDYNHPDLDDNYAGGKDFVNNEDPMDDNGHGTHCAGIVAAEDNNMGVIGVAPNVSLYAGKVLDSDGSGYYSDIIAGIEWATSNEMDVISMSLGGSSGDTALEDACNNAYNSGTLVVAAAGNDGNSAGRGDNVGYPARYDSVIAVAATDSNDNRAKFSSTGSDVELAAPGVDILSTYWDDIYATASGTSMACPHVTGTAALVFASGVTDSDGDGNVNDEIRAILQSTAEDLGADGRDERFGYGLVDAEAAVDAVGGGDTTNTAPDAPTNPSPSNGATGVSTSPELSVDVSDPDDDSMDVSFYNASDDSLIGTETGVASGSTASVTWDSLSYSTTYSWYAVADDGAATNTSSTWSFTTEEETTSGEMYVDNISMWLDRTRGPWEDIGVEVTVVDSDGNSLSDVTVDIQLETPEDNLLTGTATTDSSGVASIIFDKASRTSGTYTATVTGLSLSGYTWNESADVETSDTLNTG